jgi:putative hemolysin
MGSVPILAVAIVLAFTGASFFFSLAETALFSLGKWQVRQLSERHPQQGGMVASLLAQPQDLLATIALGNTFAGAAMLAVSLWMALHDYWPWVATLLGWFILNLAVGEVLPKTMAVRQPETWALRLARPLAFLLIFARPVCRVAQAINSAIIRVFTPQGFKSQTALTDADYQELLEMAFQSGALALSEKEIILQIVRLDRRTVKEVMRPRSRMAAISDDLSIEEMIAASRQYRHRRLPIYDETPDTIVGVLNTRALLLDPQIDLADAIEFPSFVPESMNLLQLFISLQRQRRGLAIVMDEFGGTAGIVTLEDILEEIIGKIRGDTGASGVVMEKLGRGRWRVSGTVRIDDFRREYPAIGDVPEVETMGGLLMLLLDVVPGVGDSAAYRGLKLTAQVADERRVRELIVEAQKPKGDTLVPEGRAAT